MSANERARREKQKGGSLATRDEQGEAYEAQRAQMSGVRREIRKRGDESEATSKGEG